MGTNRVALQELKGRRRFKYRYEHREYYLSLPPVGTLLRNFEEQLRILIEADLAAGTHDNTQLRYKQLLKGESLAPRIQASDKFREYLTATGRSLEKGMYYYTLRMLENWKAAVPQFPACLAAMQYSAATYNDRRRTLDQFCEWLIRQKLLSINPFTDVPAQLNRSPKRTSRKWLNDEEVAAILEAIRTNRFVSPFSRFSHAHYYPIFLFLAYTGVRPAEAIGLQVSKVNFIRKTVTIDQALARSLKGTSHAARKMKTTKTGDAREISISNSPQLLEMLQQQCVNRWAKDLVFPSPTGLSCDDRKMNGVLREVLKGLSIEPRVLYVFRHSFVSRCCRQKMDIKAIQVLTGHRDVQILLNTYAEVTTEGIGLPILLSAADSG